MKLINQFDLKLTKKRSIPTYDEVLHFEELSAVIYIQYGEKSTAKGFSGRKIKSTFNYRFHSIESMKKYIEDWKQRLKDRQQSQKEEAKKRQEYKHTFQVGDILSTCWGYDQTNVEFFEVVAVISNKSIKLCEVSDQPHHIYSKEVKPCKGNFIGEPIVRRVSYYGSVMIDKVRLATKLNCESTYRTPLYMRH